MTRLLLILWNMLSFLYIFEGNDFTSERESEINDRVKSEQLQEEHYDHLVYIGDSLMRYQVLGFLYEWQFRAPAPRNLTFNEGTMLTKNSAKGGDSILSVPNKHRRSWNDYLLISTEVFNGQMICDCYRGPIFGKSTEIFENRFYSDPQGKLHLSFIQKFGDSPAKGKKHKSDMKVYSNLDEANKNLWWSHTYEDLFANHIKQLSPAPTVVVLNQKPWVVPYRKSKILSYLPAAIRAALNVVDKVIWMQGAITRTEASKKNFNGTVVDALMRDVICNKDHPHSVKVERDGRTFLCDYAEFPYDLIGAIYNDPTEYFADIFHFADSKTYRLRNEVALRVAGLAHLTNVVGN